MPDARQIDTSTKLGPRAAGRAGRADAGTLLRVHLLGRFQVLAGAEEVAETSWRLRKARSLVKLLALAPGHRLGREQILELLWPDLGPQAATNNFHRTLHAARGALAGGPASALRLRDHVLTLAEPASLWIDLEAFEAAAAAARGSRDPADFTAALALYQGDLLPDDLYEEWAAPRREAARQTYLTLLRDLARLREERGEAERAIAALQRLIAAEPAHEEAHVALMRQYTLTGRRQSALRQFHHLKAVLQRELELEPSADSQRLYADILAGRVARLEARPPAAPAAPPSSPPSPARTPRRAAPLTNLPLPVTSFVGRERELEELPERLRAHRLLTLVGSGKTRLALEVAARVVQAYPDGVWLVELAPVADPALVPAAVAMALGLREEAGQPIAARLVDHLRDKRLLLVLDNCEHQISACAALVDQLLRSCPELRILATSRERLRAPGEVIWPVPPLDLPDPRRPRAPDELLTIEAVQLFVERAQLSAANFRLTDHNARLVAQICQRVEGLPLAIELTAAWTRMLRLEDILARLDDSLRLMTAGPRTLAPRQQTLWANIDWSYQLLAEPGRRLLRRLSVFAGGFSLDAAAAVCAGDGLPAGEVDRVLFDLIDKSLVTVEAPAVPPRFRLLEPIRQYGARRLAEAGELAATRRRHRDWCLALAEQAAGALRGPQTGVWLERLELEHDNLRAALTWSEQEPGGAEPWARLLIALWLFWEVRGHFAEGLRWLDAALARGAEIPERPRAGVFNAAGNLARDIGDYGRASRLHEQNLRLCQELGDTLGVAKALNNLGNLALDQGRYGPAGALYEESLALFRQLEQPWDIANTLSNLAIALRSQGDHTRATRLLEEALTIWDALGEPAARARSLDALGEVARDQGDYERAARLHEQSLTIRRELGDKRRVAVSLNNLGIVARYQGDCERAVELTEEALALRREVGDRRGIAASLSSLGRLALQLRDPQQAGERYREALLLRRELGGAGGIAECLAGLAMVAALERQPERAARLLGAAEALREAAGLPLPAGERAGQASLTADLCAELGEQRFAASRAAGRAMSPDEAVAAALGDRETPRVRPLTSPDARSGRPPRA